MNNLYSIEMMQQEVDHALNKPDTDNENMNHPSGNTGYNGRLFIPPNQIGASKYNLFQNQSGIQKLNTNIIGNNHMITDVSEAFFTTENQEIIQQAIVSAVYSRSNGQYNIGRQNDNELQVIMSSMYYQHGKNRPTGIVEQINELNGLVIEECVRIIIPNVQQHLGYIKDITSGISVMPRPQNVSNAGKNTFSMLIV
jgi:hypothetical protein